MVPPPGPPVLDPAVVDAYGELVFGRRLRLHVLLWVAERDDVFNQSQAAAGVGYSSSGEVGKELERLVALEMVRKFGRPSRVGPQNYARLADHPGWLIAEAARTAIAAGALEPGGAGEQAPRTGTEPDDGARPRDAQSAAEPAPGGDSPVPGKGSERVSSIRRQRDG